MSLRTWLDYLKAKTRKQNPEPNGRLLLPVSLAELRILEERLNATQYDIETLMVAGPLLDKVRDLREALESGNPIGNPELEFKNNQLTLQHWAVRLFAESFWDSIDATGAENYLEFDFLHPRGGISVVVQRADGLSPAKKVAKLQAELDQLKAQLASKGDPRDATPLPPA